MLSRWPGLTPAVALALVVSVLCVGLFIWQDRVHPCNDGDRYTSGRAQPYPFHRRWCGWPPRLLRVVSWACLVGLGVMMGSWKGSLLLLTLPGAWFIATHPTTVDAPSMLLALGGASLFPEHPYAACLLSCLSGFIHERGPVFAALYAAHPLLLVGLVASGWWRKAAGADKDKPVGRGLMASIQAHRKYTDFLDWKVNLFSLRGLVPFAAFYGVSPAAWLTLAVAWASRLVGTDAARFLFWAAPVLVRELPDVPAWLVLVHAVSFRRMI